VAYDVCNPKRLRRVAQTCEPAPVRCHSALECCPRSYSRLPSPGWPGALNAIVTPLGFSLGLCAKSLEALKSLDHYARCRSERAFEYFHPTGQRYLSGGGSMPCSFGMLPTLVSSAEIVSSRLSVEGVLVRVTVHDHFAFSRRPSRRSSPSNIVIGCGGHPGM
jgi:hypothetical protein